MLTIWAVFCGDKAKEDFFSIIDRVGMMPLPPYITKPLEDKDRYQTVYAEAEGSAAAPTAGLHFDKDLLAEIEKMGVIRIKKKSFFGYR